MSKRKSLPSISFRCKYPIEKRLRWHPLHWKHCFPSFFIVVRSVNDNTNKVEYKNFLHYKQTHKYLYWIISFPYRYISLAMPKSAIFTTRPGPFVVNKQLRAAISLCMKWLSSKYLHPLATSNAQSNKSLIASGDALSWSKRWSYNTSGLVH